MAHAEGFAPQLEVELSSHEEPLQDVDGFFADDPREVRGSPLPAPIEVLSESQLNGACPSGHVGTGGVHPRGLGSMGQQGS